MLTAITGINWGDEGKGRMVDLLAEEQDIVVRYQGGNNAGHTVVNDRGKFILNLLPSGILRPDIVNIMATGMAIDLQHLAGELQRLRDAGVTVSPENLKISDKAIICMPYNVAQDGLEEKRLKDAKFGSTMRGIGPIYGDKYLKKALRIGDLLDPDYLRQRLAGILEWKNLTIEGVYNSEPFDYQQMLGWLEQYGEPILPHICDISSYLRQAVADNKKIMFEAQLGALRDIDYGIYPFTSSSSTLAAYAPIGAGLPGLKLDRVMGVMKAYSSCVGEGPFIAEMFGDEAEALRAAGNEYGAATGRPRRVGGFDMVASRYGTLMQGATELALTKIDVLSALDQIPVIVAYEADGERFTDFTTGGRLNRARPVIEYQPGWKRDISGCRKLSDLPREARSYVQLLEDAVQCPISYISVGPERDAFIPV
ncbi:MAG: adenylosuccinate synthase [Clostridia bacterium]|nr:adenylosuccinate synthase [Clostridia bacterium]